MRKGKIAKATDLCSRLHWEGDSQAQCSSNLICSSVITSCLSRLFKTAQSCPVRREWCVCSVQAPSAPPRLSDAPQSAEQQPSCAQACRCRWWCVKNSPCDSGAKTSPALQPPNEGRHCFVLGLPLSPHLTENRGVHLLHFQGLQGSNLWLWSYLELYWDIPVLTASVVAGVIELHGGSDENLYYFLRPGA